MKPVPMKSYELCKGQSPVGTHICADREYCKRFEPDAVTGNFKEFWLAASCPKFEAKEHYSEEKPKLGW